MTPASEPVPAPARTVLLVLGMHRSGTSALAGVLHRLGAALPEDRMAASADNVKGYYEPNKIVAAHDAILERLGQDPGRTAAWSDWVTDFHDAIGTAEAAGRLEQPVDHLAGLVEQEYGQAPLVLVKDPRACLLLPLWERVAGRLSAGLRAVLSVRDPHEVAASLAGRTHTPMLPEEAYLAWLRHSLDAERWSRAMPRAFVPYPMLLANWRASVATLCRHAGLMLPVRTAAMERDVDDFLDSGLRHQRAPGEAVRTGRVVAGWLDAVQDAMARLAQAPSDPEAMAMMDVLAPAFGQAVQALGPPLIECRRRLEEAMGERERLVRELDVARGRLSALEQATPPATVPARRPDAGLGSMVRSLGRRLSGR